MISACFDKSIPDLIAGLNEDTRRKGSLQSKQAAHLHLCFHGLEFVPSVNDTLLSMFVESESFSDATKLLNRFPPQAENSWANLIQVYVERGAFDHGFEVFYRMQEERLQPNPHVFSALLKACAKMKNIEKGREIYTQIMEQGLENEIFIGSGLVDMYVKCESLVEAQNVLYHMSKRNVVTWTSLMAGYTQSGLGEEALHCLDEMEREGICANWVSFIYGLKACTYVESSIHRGMEIHNRVLEAGFDQDLAVCTSLMDMYLRQGWIREARAIFDKVKVRNVVLWTEFILGYVEHGLGKEALQCFERMRLEGVEPDVITYICVLKACIGSRFIKEAREIHLELVKEGFEIDIRVGNALVDMYAKCGLINEATETFEELQIRNVVLRNAVQGGCVCKSNDGEDSSTPSQGFQSHAMPLDVVCWTSIISGYAEQGETEVAVEFFGKMIEQGASPNAISFISILKGCGDTASLNRGKVIHAQVCNIGGCEGPAEMVLQTALIDMYSKCGSMADAQRIFDEMRVKDSAAWNALIGGYACQGDIKVVTDLVSEMSGEGIPPNEITLISTLIVCSHSGVIKECQKYLEIMEESNRSISTVKEVNCVIDLLSRAGRVSEGLEIAREADVPTDDVTWNTILGACRKLGDLDQGREVFDYMVRLGNGRDGAYITMSNLYADGYIRC